MVRVRSQTIACLLPCRPALPFRQTLFPSIPQQYVKKFGFDCRQVSLTVKCVKYFYSSFEPKTEGLENMNY